MRIQSSILLLIAGLVQSAPGQFVPAPQASNARQERRRGYLESSRKIFADYSDSDATRQAVNRVPSAQVEEVTARLHDLLAAEIEDVLAGPNPSAQSVVDAVRSLLGGTALSEWDKQTTNTPFAAFIDLNGARVLAASYSVLRGGGAIPNTRSYLEFYVLENGAWHPKVSADLDFDGCTFFVSPMDAGLSGQAWFLAWGKLFGDTGSRIKLRLYTFDGESAKAVWQRDGLVGGSVSVTGNSVSLEYDKEYHSAERVHETMHIAPDGLR